MKRIRVLFLSIQPSVLASLLSFFSGDPFIIPDLDDYDNYDKHRRKYEVVVFDDGSLTGNEFEIIKKALSEKTKCKKILYTHSTDKDYFHFLESSGVDGIVSKRADIKILEEAIIKVAGGEKYYCKYVKEFLSGNYGIEEKVKMLSHREQEIMQLLKQGLKNKEIAEKLFICSKTVENHKENIKHKLGLKSVSELFRIL